LRLPQVKILEQIGPIIADQKVSASPTPQLVIPAASNQPVVTPAALQLVITRVALHIVVSTASNEAVEEVAAKQVIAVVAPDGVIAKPAHEQVIAPEAGDLIAPVATLHLIGVDIASEDIGKIAEVDFLDRRQDIALRIPRPGRRRLVRSMVTPAVASL
jgi:hypothetical protein